MPEKLWTVKVRFPNGDLQDCFVYRPTLEQAKTAACWIAFSETVLETADGLETLAKLDWGKLTEEEKQAIAIKNNYNIAEEEQWS